MAALPPAAYKYGPLFCWVGYALLWWLILPRLRWDAAPAKSPVAVARPQRVEAASTPVMVEEEEDPQEEVDVDIGEGPEDPDLAEGADSGPDTICNSSQRLRKAGRWLDIGIASAPDHFAQRDKIRASWLDALRAQHKQDGCVRARFFIGHDDWVTAAQGQKPTPEQLALELKISAETAQHGDIVRIMMVDREKNLVDKVFQVLDKGVEDRYAFILKVSDDVELNAEKMKAVFREIQPNTYTFGGSALIEKKVPDQNPSANPPYFLSRSYFVSWPLAKRIVKSEQTVELFGYATKAEDATVGHWVRQVADSVDEVVYKSASYVSAKK